MAEHLDNLRRSSLRLEGYDYGQPGMYFVTLVTWQREFLFGQATTDEMVLNKTGSLAQSEWNRLADRFPGIELDQFILMPNHLHGIVTLAAGAGLPSGVGARREEPPMTAKHFVASPAPLGGRNYHFGNITGAYKSTVARLINGLRHTPGAQIWQRNYYEHVIRDEGDLNRIRQYIQNNVCNWMLDQENPHRQENR